MALCSLFFGAFALFVGREALLHDGDLVIKGFIRLGPVAATIVLWSFATMFAVVVAIGIYLMIAGIISKERLTLSATEISVPKYGFPPSVTVLKLADIRHMYMQTIHKQTFLHLVHTPGKTRDWRFATPDSRCFR